MNNRLSFVQALLGSDCLLCGAPAGPAFIPGLDPGADSGSADFCLPCRKTLPYLSSSHCSVCAVPVTGASTCGACLAKPPAFDRTVAAFEYAFPVDALLQSLKYRSNLAMARVLAGFLSARITSTVNPAELPDYIIPMPLHAKRLRERGFNQAVEIARYVSKSTHIPLFARACQRTRDTPSQTELPWKEREKNIRGAFTCEADFSGKRVVILDDVMTTGASVNELAKLVSNRGAMRVSVWVVARTLP
ncbi:MAG TPA: ComF family protein [Nitrosospira sp.]|nr:ComF family protein [Nitrosospira sp.]